MSFHAANPARFSHLSLRPVEQAKKTPSDAERWWRIAPFLRWTRLSNRAAIAAHFSSQCADSRTLLDSFNTGHAGSLATIHANSAAKALTRFANLVMRSHAQTTFSDTEAEIGEAVDLVVHVERQDGRRVVREVLALRGYEREAKRFLIEPVFEVQDAAA